MSTSPASHPGPAIDFEFTSFNPNLASIFPNPPPLPSSADLFSPAETTDLLGFLDNFNDLNWDFGTADLLSQDSQSYDAIQYNDHPSVISNPHIPYPNPHLNTPPEPSASIRSKISTRGSVHNLTLLDKDRLEYPDQNSIENQSLSMSPASPVPSSPFSNLDEAQRHAVGSANSASRTKPLLSTPQKRLNHIMSEQKRRNAIRDGYAQLISLLSPADGASGIAMPTRGRPKGSGSRGKGQSKGKSGVLFRAVEYCRWLEEGRNALREEVLRVEAAAGIHP